MTRPMPVWVDEWAHMDIQPMPAVVSPAMFSELAEAGYDLSWYIRSRPVSAKTWEGLYGPRYPITPPPVQEGPVLLSNVLAGVIPTGCAGRATSGP